MKNTGPTGLRTFKGYIVAVLLAAMLFGGGALFVLGSQVQRELENLRSASSDNVQWNLSQLEVDLSVLQVALEAADRSDGDPLSIVRRRFDALYSRLNTLTKGALFNVLSNEIEITDALQKIDSFMQETATIVDGPDALLLASVTDISEQVNNLRHLARNITITGVEIFAKQSTEQRALLSKLLLRVSLLAGAMIIAMAVSIFVLFRQFSITERESAKRLQANARLQSTVEVSLDAVIVADRDGRVIDFNGAAANIFGYTQDEAIGQKLTDLIVPNRFREAHRTGMERYLATGNKTVLDSGLLQLAAIRKNGEEFPIEISIASATGPEGTIFVSFIRDISERLEAQNELTAARDEALAADKAKSNFLAVMSHEMRTPLNGIMGTLDLMGATPMTPKQTDYISVATKSGNLLLRHINDVLDITKAEAGNLELSEDIFAPEALVDEVVITNTLLAQSRGNTLAVKSHIKTDMMAKADSFRLRQILLNFVGNAIKFTSNGTITIEVSLSRDESLLEFFVIDDGIGISKENLEHIFEDFVTVDASYGRRAGGTGLGLGICRRVADAIGGEIGLESELGAGSKFWLRIPFVEPTDAETQINLPETLSVDMLEPSERGLSILVVEDNQVNRFVIRAMLENFGHTVNEATDGLEGVHMSEQTTYDVIFMDVSMPVMDGVTATKQIRKTTGKSSNSTIIGLTAHAISDEQEIFLSAGMDAVLTKPVSSIQLGRVLDETASRAGRVDGRAFEIGEREHSEGLDQTILEDIRVLLGPEKFKKMFEKFVAEITESLPKLALPTNEVEFERTRLLAHKLSGSAATFGAKNLRDWLLEIENICKSGDLKAFPQAHLELSQTWQKTLLQYEKINGSKDHT